MTADPKSVVSYLKSKGLSENFCPVPFSTLLFEADGQVCMCRQKGNFFSVGDITKNTVEEIWNGEKLRNIRAEFLSGNIETCKAEIRRDKCNLSSDLTYLLDKIDYSTYQTKLPIRITPNFNGKCNLECPMCRVWSQPNGLYDKVHFWEDLETKVLPHLVEIDSFSGEPFIQKDTYRLINLASRINKDINWNFTTNGQWIFNDHMRSHLDKINLKHFIFSIDSLDTQTYEKIRKKGSLAKAVNSLLDLKAYRAERVAQGRGNFAIGINITLQVDNWKELPEFISFINQHQLLHAIRCLTEPHQFSLLLLEETQKLEILNYYLEKIPAADLPKSIRAISPLIENISPLERKKFFLQYISKSKIFDQSI